MGFKILVCLCLLQNCLVVCRICRHSKITSNIRKPNEIQMYRLILLLSQRGTFVLQPCFIKVAYVSFIKGWQWVQDSSRPTAIGMGMVSNNTQLVVRAQTVLRRYPHNTTPPAVAWTVETRQGECMLSRCLLQIHLNFTAEIKTHQTRPHFSTPPILVSLCKL